MENSTNQNQLETTTIKSRKSENKTVKIIKFIFLGELKLIPILIVLSIVFALFEPRFASLRNLQNIFLQTAVLAPVAVGQTLVILSGGFDLSVGSILGIASAVSAVFAVSGKPLWMAFAIPFLIGGAMGAFNGIMITRFRISPLIATLGMLTIGRGLTELYLQGKVVYAFPWAFRFIGTTKVFGVIPTAMILTIVLFLIFFLVLKYTLFGRSIYAIGGNEEAAFISGINVNAIKIGVYSLSGLLSAWAGVILIMRMNASEITAGTGMELQSIATVVIGGILLTGGKGNVWQTLLGVFTMGIILNGLDMIGVSPFFIKITNGLILLLVVALGSIQLGKKK